MLADLLQRIGDRVSQYARPIEEKRGALNVDSMEMPLHLTGGRNLLSWRYNLSTSKPRFRSLTSVVPQDEWYWLQCQTEWKSWLALR